MLSARISTEITDAMRSVFGEQLLSIVLYGSAARGENTPDSDIDLALFLGAPMTADQFDTMASWFADAGLRYDMVFPLSTSNSQHLKSGFTHFRFTKASRRRVLSFGKQHERVRIEPASALLLLAIVKRYIRCFSYFSLNALNRPVAGRLAFPAKSYTQKQNKAVRGSISAPQRWILSSFWKR